jgi:hypothetical protein
MNMSELPKLIADAEAKATAAKTSIDNFVSWIANLRTDMHQCEAELEQKRRAADQLIAQLQSQIAKLKAEHANAELELKQVRREVERERSDWAREKKLTLQSLDEALAR